MSFEAEQGTPVDDKKRLPAGDFIGRDKEQTRFRQMLLEMAGARKGIFGGLLGSAKKAKTEQPIKSFVLLLDGPLGSGKTRLARRLRDLAQKEKEFTGRFKTTRLDWAELFERDSRLTALLPNEPLPPETLLDIFQTHCNRDNGGGYFDEYKNAVEETKKLTGSVSGAELDAVWEYRARAIGKSLADWSNERYLIFFMDAFQLVAPAVEKLFRPMFEESGGRVLYVLSGEGLPDLSESVAPERYAYSQLGGFSEAELIRFYEAETARYGVEIDHDEDDAKIKPEILAELETVTGNLPLSIRLVTFLLQTGIEPEELTESGKSGLLKLFFERPLDTGHPDRLKLYALAILRRPEQGLVAAMFDTRKDMLPVEDVLERLNQRYLFLFEPGRPMTLHKAILKDVQGWLLEPMRRYDRAGLMKINERALEYLDARLAEWSINFPSLKERVADLKWREWALDKMWHSFWLNEERGWAEALALLVAGLAVRPGLARQVVAQLETLNQIGALGESSQHRLALFSGVVKNPQEARSQLRELRVMGQDGGFFRTAMPQFSDELGRMIDSL